MPAELIDTHTHLTLDPLAPEGESIWERARQSGVVQAVVVGIDRESSERVVAFAQRCEGAFAAVGIHPSETETAGEADLAAIRQMLPDQHVVAVGESGLDYYWMQSAPDVQRRHLEAHAELSLDADLPLVLHLRDAFEDAARVLEPFVTRGLRAVVHCFTGGPAELEPFVSWGFAISFSGILTYPGAGRLREAAAQAPADACLVETDAPWLPPQSRRGQVNEPAWVRETVETLARVRDLTPDETAALTTRNARRVFDLPVP